MAVTCIHFQITFVSTSNGVLNVKSCCMSGGLMQVGDYEKYVIAGRFWVQIESRSGPIEAVK